MENVVDLFVCLSDTVTANIYRRIRGKLSAQLRAPADSL